LTDDALNKLRGKTATITFKLVGGDELYLDNVGFQNEHLKLGNITDARWDLTGSYHNNLLLEKPQYVVSYNNQTKIANWVAWKIDSTWLDSSAPKLKDDLRPEFIADPVLLSNTELPTYDGSIFTGLGMDRGHITANEDRSRTLKDQLSTFLNTNLIAQAIDNNRFVRGESDPVWVDIEDRIREMVKLKKKEVYVFAGAFGNNLQPQIRTNIDSFKDDSSMSYTNPTELISNHINIPEWTWKVYVTKDPSKSSENPTAWDVFAFITPNTAELDNLTTITDANGKTVYRHPFLSKLQIPVANGFATFGTTLSISNVSKWRTPGAWYIPVGTLESILNTHSTSYQYNFFSELSPEIQSILKKDRRLPANLTAPLMADNSFILNFTVPSPQAAKTGHEFTIFSNTISEPVVFKVAKAWQISFSEVDSEERRLLEYRRTGLNSLQVAVPETHGSHVTIYETGISPIATPEVTTTQVAASPDNIPQINIAPFSTIDITETSRLKLDSIQNSSTQIDVSPFESSKVFFPSSITSQKLVSGNLSHDNTPLLASLYSTTQNLWQSTPINLTFNITDLPTGQLAEATITGYNPNGTPNTATITLDHNANGLGWFIDTTPQDNNEFQQGNLGTGISTDYYIADPNSPAYGKYDLLTTILHEMGHTLGFINGYSEFDKYVKGNKFITDTFTAVLTRDGSHLDTAFHPYDLMNTSLKPGVRKLPSALNLAMMNAINSGIGSQKSAIEGITAPLTAGALIAINNGDFSTNTGWDMEGETNILNGSATLTEQSQKLASLTQAFTTPTGAKRLQFTIVNNNLVPDSGNKSPNDAFEVALLDANTFNPLAGTIGLSHSDSLLNIQANGTIHKSDRVTINPKRKR
jgi:DNA/RNA endonuclease G (NUC1)